VAASGEFLLAVAGGQQAVMAQSYEALWQDMQEEAAQELVAAECQRLLLVVVGIVLVVETNRAIVDGKQTVITDGDPMAVAAEVAQNLLWACKGVLGVDVPSRVIIYPGGAILCSKPARC